MSTCDALGDGASPSSRPIGPPPPPQAQPGWALAIALTTYLIIILDISIVVAALPEIGRDFGLSPVGLSWVQNAYLL